MTITTRTLTVLVLVALFAVSPAAQSPGAVNTLTPAEKSAGWILLFDGNSTVFVRGYKKPDMTALRWKVEDGCLALPAGEGTDTQGQRDVITTREFDDFELSWDWRIGKGGNSGVKYFVTEKHESAIGHEYQVIPTVPIRMPGCARDAGRPPRSSTSSPPLARSPGRRPASIRVACS